MNTRLLAHRGVQLRRAAGLMGVLVFAACASVETARARAETRYAEDQRDAVQVITMSPEQQAAELQRQIDELQAQRTADDLAATLDDVLFASGRADLNAAAAVNLDKLVVFLNAYPNRTVAIEGYTDNVGSQGYNQRLSQRRANSVKRYLVRRNIRPMRLVASGKGEAAPVAGNESAAGRRQNRRVEVDLIRVVR